MTQIRRERHLDGGGFQFNSTVRVGGASGGTTTPNRKRSPSAETPNCRRLGVAKTSGARKSERGTPAVTPATPGVIDAAFN